MAMEAMTTRGAATVAGGLVLSALASVSPPVHASQPSSETGPLPPNAPAVHRDPLPNLRGVPATTYDRSA